MSYYTCIYYRNCQEYRRNQPKWVVVVFKNDCDELYGIHGALFHGNKQHAQRILDIYTETIKKEENINAVLMKEEDAKLIPKAKKHIEWSFDFDFDGE